MSRTTRGWWVWARAWAWAWAWARPADRAASPVAARAASVPPAASARSLAIFGAGAVIGLVMAGIGLFTAQGSSVGGLPPEVLAQVNQRPILRSDFAAQAELEFSLPLVQLSDAQRRKVLTDMVREELMVQRGIELDMAASDPAVRAALVASVEQQALAGATAEKATPEALSAFYDAHRDQFLTEGTMTLLDLVLSPGTPADVASQAPQRLRAEGTAPAVLAQLGLRPSGRVTGEQYYFAGRIHLGDALFKVAQGLSDGEVSAPQPLPDGLHILVMQRHLRPVLRPYAQVQSPVLQAYRKDLQARLLGIQYEYLRKKSDIVIAPGFAFE